MKIGKSYHNGYMSTYIRNIRLTPRVEQYKNESGNQKEAFLLGNKWWI